jgi:hypothetical protein
VQAPAIVAGNPLNMEDLKRADEQLLLRVNRNAPAQQVYDALVRRSAVLREHEEATYPGGARSDTGALNNRMGALEQRMSALERKLDDGLKEVLAVVREGQGHMNGRLNEMSERLDKVTGVCIHSDRRSYARLHNSHCLHNELRLMPIGRLTDGAVPAQFPVSRRGMRDLGPDDTIALFDFYALQLAEGQEANVENMKEALAVHFGIHAF